MCLVSWYIQGSRETINGLAFKELRCIDVAQKATLFIDPSDSFFIFAFLPFRESFFYPDHLKSIRMDRTNSISYD